MRLAAIVLVALGSVARAETCVTVDDASPGWKRLELADGSSLAAPEGISQFRTGEPALVLEDLPIGAHGPQRHHEWRTRFSFDLGDGARRLMVRFVEPLRGAKVDVHVRGPGRSYAIWSDRRVSGDSLEVALDEDLTSVWLEVHDHLRHEPAVRSWQVERLVDPERALTNVAFGRALHWLQPAGGAVRICEAPGRVLTVRARDWKGVAKDVKGAPR